MTETWNCLNSPFDTDADDNIYKASFDRGFSSVNLGRVAQTGLAQSVVQDDLTVVGAFVEGVNLGDVDLVYVDSGNVTPGLQAGGQLGDGQMSLVYFSSTGRLLLDSPTDSNLTSIEIDSNTSIFTGPSPQRLVNPTDSVEPDNIFKASFDGGFGSLNLGKLAQSNLAESFLQGDLTVVGSSTSGQTISSVDLLYLSGPEAQVGVRAGGQQGDGQTSIIYDSNTGQVSIDAPAEDVLTWVDIESKDEIFVLEPSQNLDGPFDSDTSGNLFKFHIDDGFGSLTFGNVAPPRLSEDFLHDDLTVVGMLASGQGLGEVDLVYIPRVGGPVATILYDPNTGEIRVIPPEGVEFTSINLDSASGIFSNDIADNLGGSFDNDADTNIFKANFGGSFGEISFGNVAQPGLSPEFVLNDLTIVGSLAGGFDLGDIEIVFAPIIPEPSSVILLVLGMFTARCLFIGRGCYRRA